MTTRSLTEVYILMRNNAIQSRHIYSEQASMSDRVRLVRSNSHHNVDVETGSQGLELRGDSLMPPVWVDSLEEAQYIMTRLRTKIGELKAMHSKHLQRPTLDDSGSEEQHIGRLTSELTKHFNTAHRLVQTIKGQSRQGSQTEQRLTRNVVTALVTTLQDISLSFRNAQGNYLKSLTSREERSNAYFELPNFEELSLDNEDLLPGLRSTAQTDDMFTFGPSCSGTLKNNKNSSAFFEEEEDGDIDEIFQKPGMNQKQLMAYAEENTKLAAQREEEVNKIVRSILDLNDVFKDLAHMVQDQGSVLDRIDYNIEMTQMQVHSGMKQLQKAESYQRKNRKMHCICVLGFTIMFLIIILIVVKS